MVKPVTQARRAIRPAASSNNFFVNLLGFDSFLSITQMYVGSIADFNVALYPVFLVLSIPFIKWGQVLRQRVVQLTAAIIIYDIISWIWAVDLMEGVRFTYFSLMFFGFLCLAVTLAYKDRVRFILVCRAYCIMGLAQSGLVIIFRAVPAIKLAFLGSAVSSLFLGKTAAAETMMTTIMDPGKSGGFLLTPNSAGAWSLGLAFLTLAAFNRSRFRVASWIIAAVHFLGAATCGSKATLVLLVVLVSLLIFHAILQKVPSSQMQRVLVAVAVVSAGCGAVLIAPIVMSGRFFQASSDAAASRSIMWNFAVEQFKRTPFLGLGYGGWESEFFTLGNQYKDFKIGVSGNLAAHDLFIDLWSTAGLGAVILGVLFILAIYQLLFRGYRIDPDRGKYLIAAFSAYIIQSLGENYQLFSAPNIAGVLAMILGLGHVVAMAPANARSAPRGRPGAVRSRTRLNPGMERT